jgi:alpha-galactosidase
MKKQTRDGAVLFISACKCGANRVSMKAHLGLCLAVAVLMLCFAGESYGAQVASDSVQKSQTAKANWTDVLFVEKPEPTISYRSGWGVYEESLTKGNFVGRGWNGSGFISFYDGRVDPAQHPMPEAFELEIDGQALVTDWEWAGLEKTSDGNGDLHAVITLKNKVRPVTIRIHTLLDGTAVLTRWIEITNTGKRPAALAIAIPWSGVLQEIRSWQSFKDTKASAYSLGYFDSTEWGTEGDFHWHELPAAGYRVDGRVRRDRYRSPFFVLRNNATGEYFVGELAWTGGYSFQFDFNPEGKGGITFQGGPDGQPPLRVISPGETVKTPEMHLGLVFGGLDAAVQSLHTHLRRSVFPPQSRGRGGWIESGIGPEVEVTTEEVNHSIDVAAEFGAEVFFIDASWYAKPKGNWWSTVGDWNVDRQRFPQGLKPFRDRAHAKGMLWGLWMDAERIGDESNVAKQHPDWLAMNYDGERKIGGLLDLTNPEAAKYMEEQISRVIKENQCEFFRLDHNTHAGRGIMTVRDGFEENGYWRYYEALYGVYDRLRAKFPNVIFENCAGGGGRADIGMVRHFDHTDVTDWQIGPRSFMITNGMTMALPPEHIDRLVGGQSGHTTADYDFQSRQLFFLMPKFAFLYPLGSQPNPLLIQRTLHFVDLYKNFVRPFMDTGRLYHHTPELSGLNPHGWGVLELASEDRTRGICGLFQLSAPAEPEYLLRPRGLDVSRRYEVTFDNSGQTVVVDGLTLTQQGIKVRLEGALTSELLLFRAI